MRISRYAPVALLAIGAAVAAGCGGGGSPGPAAGGTDTPTTAAAATTAPTSATLVLHSDQQAAEHLFEAWKANDKPAALLGATPTAIDDLWTWGPWTADTYFWGGCTGGNPSDCQYNYAQGAIIMNTQGDAAGAWTVVGVTFSSAG